MMKEGIQPQRLQLIGATALVVASKIEVFTWKSGHPKNGALIPNT
jgi:hypothetical protein